MRPDAPPFRLRTHGTFTGVSALAVTGSRQPLTIARPAVQEAAALIRRIVT